MNLSTKQIVILTILKDAFEEGKNLTVYEIMEKIPHDTKRDALLHSIKILADKGLVERAGRELRTGKLPFQTFKLSAMGLAVL